MLLKKVLIYNNHKEIIMKNLNNMLNMFFMFEKEPQKIGLSQFKENNNSERNIKLNLKKNNIKLSDLMRKN